MDVVVLAALAEPNRLRIVELLHAAPRPVGEIAAALALRQPQVTKHLQTLERAGLVRGHQLGRRRIYTLQRAWLQSLATWATGFADAHPSEGTLIEYQHAIEAEQRRWETDRGPRVIRLRRTMPAPPHTLWRAWTDHRQIRRWWSPRHFDVADCDARPTPGGELTIVMVEGDGTRHRAHGRFIELHPSESLTFELAPIGIDGEPLFNAAYSVRLTPSGTRRTVVTIRIRVTNPAHGGEPALAGIRLGWHQALDKLAALVT